MYLLDSNAFMEANRLYYGFDIAPGFWTWLASPALADQLGSIEPVKDEITAGTGDLVTWARAQPAAFWLVDTSDVVAAMTEIAAWVTDPARQYRQEAIDEFLDSADYRLIAHARATDSVVVTRERPAPDAKKKVKIPDVCIAFDVAWTDPFSAYRALGLRLVA
jgi:hypothetical protein